MIRSGNLVVADPRPTTEPVKATLSRFRRKGLPFADVFVYNGLMKKQIRFLPYTEAERRADVWKAWGVAAKAKPE